MKNYFFFALISLFLTVSAGIAHAQTYDAAADAIVPGWYYNQAGDPLYYYANGAYYNPATQSYDGSVVFPQADGPDLNATNVFTPGAPNTGAGGDAFAVWASLLFFGALAIVGVSYLTDEKFNS